MPHCPAWDAAGLIRHTGGIFQWMAAIVPSGERVSRRTLEAAPEATCALPAWYLGSLERTLAVLGAADPEAETWTFSTTGDRRVAWWCLRLAVEVALHRWDIQHAMAFDREAFNGSAPPQPLDGAVGAAGVEEFVTEFLPDLLAQDGLDGIGGALRLHATDGPADWRVDLDAGGSALSDDVRADTVVTGTRPDLLLWLANRGPLEMLEVTGNREVSDRWGQLRR